MHFIKTVETKSHNYYYLSGMGKPDNKEYGFDPKIKRFKVHNKYTLIKDIIKNEHIDIFISER